MSWSKVEQFSARAKIKEEPYFNGATDGPWLRVTFEKESWTITKGAMVIARGKCKGSLYIVRGKIDSLLVSGGYESVDSNSIDSSTTISDQEDC